MIIKGYSMCLIYYKKRYIGGPWMQTLIFGFPNVKGVSYQRVIIQSPKTQQGSLIAQQPLELLFIDFTKADIAKGGKENILVLTDVFSMYSQAFVTNNQKALTVAKTLVENVLVSLGFLPGSTVIKADPLTMKLFPTFAKCMALCNP